MAWLNALLGTVVGLDTAPLIYFIESNPKYTPLVRPFFEAVERGDIQVVTSTLTLTEVLVQPFRQGNQTLVGEYFRILHSARNLTVLPVSPSVAAEAARIRAVHGAETPDAIQLAAALEGRATAFLTNDAGMVSLPGLQLIQLDRLLNQP
jgi:predicted nucleic acid-binding protein